MNRRRLFFFTALFALMVGVNSLRLWSHWGSQFDLVVMLICFGAVPPLFILYFMAPRDTAEP